MAYSTQQQIEIAGIKDGIIIMKDGSYRLILEVTATNFALKSEMEQNSIIMQYQSFLNSLHFPIEITIRSKRLDLTPYLTKIQKLATQQQSELIRNLAGDYVDFVGKLITVANIMKKSFYVTVSYTAISAKNIGIFNSLFNKKVQNFDHLKISDADFKTSTEKLLENAGIAASGLGSIGLHCFQLSTEQIIELLYQIYNPAESSKERVTDAATLASEVVSTKTVAGKEETDQKATPSLLIDNTHIVTASKKQEAELRKQGNGQEQGTEGTGEIVAPVATPMAAPVPGQEPTTASPEPEAQAKQAEPEVPAEQANQQIPANSKTVAPLDNLANKDDGQTNPTT